MAVATVAADVPPTVAAGVGVTVCWHTKKISVIKAAAGFIKKTCSLH